MPFNNSRTASFFNKEILKYPKGFEAVRNCVIDAQSITATEATEGGDPGGRFIVEAGSVMLYGMGTVFPVTTIAPTNEIQTVTKSATGGTFTLTYDGQTTSAIAYNATSATVELALEALSNLTEAQVSVSGSAGGPYTVTFTEMDAALLTASAASLTGGAGTVTIAQGTQGGVDDLIPDGYEVAGILAYTVELFGNTGTEFNEPAALFFDDCIFDTTKLIGYAGNEDAVKAALSTSLFE